MECGVNVEVDHRWAQMNADGDGFRIQDLGARDVTALLRRLSLARAGGSVASDR